MEKGRQYLIFDIGTTSVKVSLVEEAFQIVKCVSTEYQLHTKGDRVELNPEVYWESIKQGIAQIAKETTLAGIGGITITGQGETLIPIAKDGTVLHPAVVWLDNRAKDQAKQIQKLITQEEFYKATGIPECNGLCPVSKLLWFLQELPSVYKASRYFLLLEDYIIYRLTGRVVTEKSLLSTTGYFHLGMDGLWSDLLKQLGIDADKIPQVQECAAAVAELLPEVAAELGLPQKATVVTGAMDQVCGAVGAGNTAHGMVTETTGTALCIGETIRKREIDTAYNIPVYRHYCSQLQLLLPVCMTAGMALKWFKDNFCQWEQQAAEGASQDIYEALNGLAQTSAPLANGVLMLPYLSGSLQPHNNPDLRAVFWGIGLNNTKADFVRALMEGVGYMLRENLEALEAITGTRPERIRSMGGGSKSGIWCSIKADINQLVVETGEESETASIGAAMLCAIGLGDYGSMNEIANSRKQKTRSFYPSKDNQRLYENGFAQYQNCLAYFANPKRV